MAFVTYNPSTNTLASLVTSIFTGSAGATLVDGSVSAKAPVPPGETSTISYYDGALSALGIGPGLLLTSGDPTPPELNTHPVDEFGYGVLIMETADSDADLLNSITIAYDGTDNLGPDGVYDVTWLQFQVNITDPALVGVRLDVVFGTDEYPELNGNFPDIAGVYVNGTNYALFNNDVLHPLARVNRNLDPSHTVGPIDGFFRDNTTALLPIEYDGVTNAVQVTAPVHLGINTIKIAVADTGAADFDAGLFVSNMQAASYSGFGIAQRVQVNGTAQVIDSTGSQVYLGDAADNQVTLSSGLDVVDGGVGLDEVTYLFGPSAISSGSWNGSNLRLTSGANSSELVHVERVRLAGDLYFALDTSPGGATYMAYALLQAGFNFLPDAALRSQWVAATDSHFAQDLNLGDVGQAMIDFYAPDASNESIIAYLYQNIAGVAPSSATVAEIAAQVGPGHTFETMGDLFAYASLLSYNTDELAGVVGSVQQLDANFFD
ncbi:MAG TPA: choice-of-anchor L domain-containing protein [Ramlibacter sp.]|nr:choice-of-anchor L domain-containing protein [Ramlibacter sp.]